MSVTDGRPKGESSVWLFLISSWMDILEVKKVAEWSFFLDAVAIEAML
jgi:hypothetical protein